MSETRIPTYMTDSLGPLPFCPGCGHDRLLKQLNDALVRLQPDPSKVVIVSDIGCIGLADRYFTTNAFHGLHGRSLTYATGLKLARPELTVVVLMGDGGCGIGGTHVLNAARRNVDLTLIVANNFNYGMTGGQHSVTTPGGAMTATTPQGNPESAIDLCAVAMGAGASWVCRGVSYDDDLEERIAEAIAHPGFALIDVWELCTAYYLPRNDLNRRELYGMVARSGMPTGVLRSEVRTTFEVALQDLAQSARKPSRSVVERRFDHALEDALGVVIAGSAGQKIRSAAGVFATAGIMSGLHATQKDDYPITIMTGHSISEIKFAPGEILYTAIEAPDYLAVVSEDGLRMAARMIRAMSSNGTLLLDEELDVPKTNATVCTFPFAREAKRIDRLAIGSLALGSVLALSGAFPAAAFEQAIRESQSARVAEVNASAARKGAELAKGSG